MKTSRLLALFLLPPLALAAGHLRAEDGDSAFRERLDRIHAAHVFADLHSHPSQFNRASVPKIEQEVLDRYRRARFDVIVAAAPPDTVMRGNYIDRHGKYIPTGTYRPEPGDFLDYALERLERPLRNVADGDAALADSPEAVLAARARGQVSVLLALEGAEALEEDVGNVGRFYDKGVRILQFIHFFPNALGSSQGYPFTPTGLTEFGRRVVEECNRLGIVIDMAHANSRTLNDVLAATKQPIIVGHTASLAGWAGEDRRLIHRALSDDDIRAVARNGGVVGVWSSRQSYPTVKDLVDDIDYIVRLVGEDHVGIGSDLSGMGDFGYSEGLGRQGDDFVGLERELLSRDYGDETIGKILGGNFFRVWKTVAAAKR